jgi:hypothetical protein
MSALDDEPPDLDTLARIASEGDAVAEGALFAALRERLAPVAKRRVRDEEHEDCLQDALRIVLRKYRSRPPGAGILPWSFAVLRRVVGNVYLRRGRAGAREDRAGDAAAVADVELDPLSGREARRLRERVARGIRLIEADHPRCGAILRGILNGLKRGDDADEIVHAVMRKVQVEDAAITRGNFHVILHRCRNRLRLAMEALDGPGATR